ncbi:MAG: hypothetical protein NXI30_04505 [bacterium]|nr:hypothetical protein [bacterium]
MPSQVGICNIALRLIGAGRIVSLDEDSEAARACSDLYEATREELLRTHLWRFARKREALPASSTAPLFGYDAAFPKPADCLHVFAVDAGRYATRGVRWTVEGDNVLANASAPLNILYAEDVTEAGRFDPLFAQTFSHLLAAYLCEPLTQSNTKKQLIERDLDRVYSQAIAADALESIEMIEADGVWITSRYYTGGTIDPTIVWDAWVW